VFTSIAVAIVLISVLYRHPVFETRSPRQSNASSQPGFPSDLAPTIANYQAVANESLEAFDQLLTRQSTKPVPAPSPFTAAELALANVGE
jgi:hypothetical protein